MCSRVNGIDGRGCYVRKEKSNEDYDILTDLFASVFGTH